MGTSTIRKFCAVVKQDHPHAYGDKTVNKLVDLIDEGSSPRVWGQARNAKNILNVMGIIPTRMGTRTEQGLASLRQQDHPHAYGDKITAVQDTLYL